MSEETNVVEMRKTIERLSKEKSELSTQVGHLQGEVRGYQAADAFREAGYNPAQGELFAAMNPEGEITVEAVAKFAEEKGLPALESTPESSTDTQDSTSVDADNSANLASMAGGGSRGGDGGAGGANVETLTRQQWQSLHMTDPAAAKQALASGRVEISKDNVFIGGQAAPRGTNPYLVTSDS